MHLDSATSSEESGVREGCTNCARLQADYEKLCLELEAAKEELSLWHLATDPEQSTRREQYYAELNRGALSEKDQRESK